MWIASIPDILSSEVARTDALYALVESAPAADCYGFDMQAVGFVRPYGVIALVIGARRLSGRAGRPVRLLNLAQDVRLYLDRLDLFTIGRNWLVAADETDSRWSRSPATANLLEMTPTSGPDDVATIAGRAHRIFSRWLLASDLNSLVNVLSELCANVYQHSGDRHGCVLIQKYELGTPDRALIQLAVGDLGCGIRQSLSGRLQNAGTDPLHYIRAAMQGCSARNTGRGGLGLRRVEQIVGSLGGYLWLRSETAAVMSRGPARMHEYSNLPYVPGTQVAVELRATSRI